MATSMTKGTTRGNAGVTGTNQYMKTGGMVNKNAKVSAQKMAGSPMGVGATKSTKISGATKVAGSKGVGTTKSKKLSGAIPSKMKMGGMKRGC